MRLSVAVFTGLVAGLVGCVNPQTARPQIAEEPVEKDAVPTVGSKTEVGNVTPLPAYGIGLVIGLSGTGSTPPAGDLRTQLERSLTAAGYNAKEMLDDPARAVSMVQVSAKIPAGCRVGDSLEDVTITLPDGSKTTSLKGGYLVPCDLITAASAADVRAALQAAGFARNNRPAGGGVLRGNVVGRAEGALITGRIVQAEPGQKIDTDETTASLMAQIWEGPVSRLPRPYTFELVSKDQRPGLALEIAERLNAAFGQQGYDRKPVADAKAVKPAPVVLVQVPPMYRHNHYRFLLVARHVPLVPVGPDHPYRKRLEQELLDPTTCIQAAVKLEALGIESRKALRVGLESDSPWVRFASAEALAYLGQTDGTAELADLAARHPGVRYHCLKALAALDDAASTLKLTDLMASGDPSLRYGAFAALRVADPKCDAVRGHLAATRGFHVHRVAPGSAGIVHVSSHERAEVVIFGDGGKLTGPFNLPIGNQYTVSVAAGGAEAVIAKVVATPDGAAVTKKTCRPDLGTVLLTLGEMGAGYHEAIEFCRRSDQAKVLGGPLVRDALPPGLGVPDLARIARIDPTGEKADTEVVRIGQSDITGENESLILPTEADAMQKPVVQERTPLNRDPGRLFGPRRSGDDGPVEPAPQETGPARNRDPGHLIGKI
ncbi:MAG TPA: HEAT repeat domain-containing protein [Fimbriiglobus sp.]|jgi:hypothetical protein